MTNKEFSESLVSLWDYLFKVALINYNLDSCSAKDHVQDVMLRAWEKKDSYNDDNLKAWVSVISRNLFINKYRKQKSKQNLKKELEVIYKNNELSNTQNTDVHITYKKVKVFCNKLPDKYRDIFARIYLDGMPYSVVAKEFELAVGTVKSRISRAKKLVVEGIGV